MENLRLAVKSEISSSQSSWELVPVTEREDSWDQGYEVFKKNKIVMNRLISVIEQIKEGVVVLDHDKIIRHANFAFETITGFIRDEVLDLPFSSFQLGPIEQKKSEEIFNSLTENSEWHGVYTSKKRNGTLYEEEATFSFVRDSEYNATFYVVVFQNVSERKRLESVAEAVEMMKNVGYIFSGVRHELGNPINSIKMALSVLRKNINDYSIENITKFVDRSLTEIGRVEYLLGVLRTFSMYEELKIEKVEVQPFIEKFCLLVRQDLLQKRITFDYGVAENVGVMLVDLRALHQILLNLVSNSVDALESKVKGSIHISVSLFGDRVQIKVIDNGVGITETQKSNLFKPFYTSKVKGNGLGLMIVKKMVTKMNGTIEIESQAGIKTVAILTLASQ